MMPKSVADLLSEREGTRLDFKRGLSSMNRVLETACSFLNTAGGTQPKLQTGGTGRSRATATVDERQAAVLSAIDNLERPNTADIQRRTGISTRSIGRDLRRLREAGIIEFVGSPKTGFYRRVKLLCRTLPITATFLSSHAPLLALVEPGEVSCVIGLGRRATPAKDAPRLV